MPPFALLLSGCVSSWSIAEQIAFFVCMGVRVHGLVLISVVFAISCLMMRRGHVVGGRRCD